MEPEAPELLDALLEPRDELFPGSVFPDPPFSGSVLSPSGSEPAFEGWRLPEDGGSKAEELLRLTVNPNVACGLGGRLASPGGHSSQVASPEPPRHDEAPAATAATTLYEVVCDLGTPLHGSVVSIQLATPDGGGEAAAGAGGGDAARHPAPHPGRGADPEEGAEKDPEQAVGPGQPAEEEGVPGRAGEQGGRVLSPKPGAAEENPGAGETQRILLFSLGLILFPSYSPFRRGPGGSRDGDRPTGVISRNILTQGELLGPAGEAPFSAPGWLRVGEPEPAAAAEDGAEGGHGDGKPPPGREPSTNSSDRASPGDAGAAKQGHGDEM
ncbi:cyclic AMP-responsive element-binding protein 3-like protein 4 isoform X3 [Mycteria americana]|uniref:cyclic AMP-responsive element-binding protein 3-like protein 4 isoform X3 n=1 Tax=Mycteria americana TaxID=33587 RepID=UPI003F5837F4